MNRACSILTTCVAEARHSHSPQKYPNRRVSGFQNFAISVTKFCYLCKREPRWYTFGPINVIEQHIFSRVSAVMSYYGLEKCFKRLSLQFMRRDFERG